MFDFLKRKNKHKEELYAIAEGTLIPLEEVPDEVFSSKMMGDGFAIRPANGEIYAPLNGTIKTLFPTKHAIGIESENGIEVLLHFGIDTVELEGKPFEVYVQEGDQVTKDTKLATMNLEEIAEAGKNSELMVIFTNLGQIEELSIHPNHTVSVKESIGEITLN